MKISCCRVFAVAVAARWGAWGAYTAGMLITAAIIIDIDDLIAHVVAVDRGFVFLAVGSGRDASTGSCPDARRQ